MSLLQHLWQKIKLSKWLQVHHFPRTLLRAEVAGHQWAPNPGIDRLLLEGWAMATTTPGQTQPDPQPDQPTSWYRLSVSWWEMWSLWNPQVEEGVHLCRLFSTGLRKCPGRGGLTTRTSVSPGGVNSPYQDLSPSSHLGNRSLKV